MTQNPSEPPEDNRKEAASFFSRWMNRVDKKNDGDNWDELCMQWCKQKNAARQQETGPDCRMLCLRRPLLKDKLKDTSWNPLKGYSIIAVDGKEECINHVNGMTSEALHEGGTKENSSKDIKASLGSKRYEVDLGSVWSEADTTARHLINQNVVPLFNSTIEEAIAWKNSTETAQWEDYFKSKANAIFNQIYPMQPLTINKEKKDVTLQPSPSNEKQ